jgi:uncharacterized protein
MNIWIDFINSPQVSFFDPLVEDLTKMGHRFTFTCRDSANTVQLLQQRGWEFEIIGERVEKTLVKKAFSFPRRISKLRSFLKDKQIDSAICQSSFYLPLTASLLKIPSIYTNDNEHAIGNIPSFLFADKIFVPENLSLSKVKRQGASSQKTRHYPGIKEGIYLWTKGCKIIQARKGGPEETRRIYVRPEPQTAQYYKGKQNFLDEILIQLKDEFKVCILVRDENQRKHYSQPKFSGICVPEKPLPFNEVAINCLLFIGAGGSMTREMSIMGIPTISVYQGELLAVDNFLIKEGYLKHQPELSKRFIDELLYSKENENKENTELIDKGKMAYEILKTELLNLK